MAGRGPAPNPGRQPSRKGNKKQFRVVEFEPEGQPSLPTVAIEEDGTLVEFVWPAVTVEWWKMWSEHPIADEFSAADWSFLADTALIHARFWAGALNLAAELRLRVAKFGATPEDRARLAIQFAQAEEADEKRGGKASSAGARSRQRKGLRLAD